jgi:cell division transport system ATP-binding protein
MAAENAAKGPLDPRTIISFYHVHLRYRDQSALADVTFSISNGEFVCITGPSGAGKSSVLRLITMDLFPTKGQVVVRGMVSTKMKRRRIPHLRREIGYVFQDFRLLDDRSVYDNVAFAQLVVGVPRAAMVKNVMRVLNQVGLWDKRERLPQQLSGGEQQRVAIARAMVNSPKILLADEPTGNLDPTNKDRVLEILMDCVSASNATLVTVTHDHELLDRFDRVIDFKQFYDIPAVTTASPDGPR